MAFLPATTDVTIAGVSLRIFWNPLPPTSLWNLLLNLTCPLVWGAAGAAIGFFVPGLSMVRAAKIGAAIGLLRVLLPLARSLRG